jgi:hypothetical protein
MVDWGHFNSQTVKYKSSEYQKDSKILSPGSLPSSTLPSYVQVVEVDMCLG